MRKIAYILIAAIVIAAGLFVLFSGNGSYSDSQNESSLNSVKSILAYAIQEEPIDRCTYVNVEYDYNSTLENSKTALDYINSIRESYGKNPIKFDPRAYVLAVIRAKEMRDNNYINHVNPYNGICVNNLKRGYGFGFSEYLGENIYGNIDYLDSGCTKVEVKPMQNVIDAWMESRGHRYNLLYEGHVSGAVGCYKNVCVFLGVNKDGFGSECTSAEEGKAFWDNASLQEGETA